ncbi:hypothetical protein [Butyrivibrio sp. MC2013]|uniref:hypothetical protein n=1 Tax=Butyrivibrio sp. MC2013 TaxID=1280686 RepID=UPI00041DA19C|nr:hypothetical protein [Butyrivibrio sp. MC2013]
MKITKTIMALSLAAALFLGQGYTAVAVTTSNDPYTALANATTVYQGVDYSSEYNALDYYLNYPDLQQAFGVDPFMLVRHYAVYGRWEGRIANRMLYSTTLVVPSGSTGVSLINVVQHDNGGMTAAQESVARSIASQIADNITTIINNYQASGGSSSGKKKKSVTVSEVEKVAYAAGVVRAYLDRGSLVENGRFSNSAYGVFVAGQYNSGGATRAMGLVLDYLGVTWEHANLGTTSDQWCRVVVDGVEGYADAMSGTAGEGKSPLEGGGGKGISYADIRSKFNVNK